MEKVIVIAITYYHMKIKNKYIFAPFASLSLRSLRENLLFLAKHAENADIRKTIEYKI
jgi:hypothetical protein